MCNYSCINACLYVYFVWIFWQWSENVDNVADYILCDSCRYSGFNIAGCYSWYVATQRYNYNYDNKNADSSSSSSICYS